MKKNKKQQLKQRVDEYIKNVLTDDEDWDYYFILKILTYKLKRTRECIVKNNLIEDAEKISNQILQAEQLFTNVMEDKYDEKYITEFNNKYGKCIFKKIPSKCNKTGKILSYEIKITHEHETPKNSNKIHKESLRNYEKAQKEKSNDLKKAFDIMHKHMFEWWD